ncbi:DUF7344 domain-containing protein [Halosimplex amylolyticum]|uniref:DUF7344 domain-containing protein n=1 Tax=Halosimplex amylolyticum TaxID=3396616 RepID=UPI003F57FAE5
MSQITTELRPDFAATADLTESELFGVLSERRRRLLLDVLDERTTPLGLRELATGIVAREGGDPDDIEAVRAVEIVLHHKHLPKLNALDVLDYDRDEKQITP